MCVMRGLPPDLVNNVLVKLGEIFSPEARTEILPSTVGQEDYDIALVHPVGNLYCAVYHGSGRYPGEDPLSPHKLFSSDKSIPAVNYHFAIKKIQIDYRGNK